MGCVGCGYVFFVVGVLVFDVMVVFYGGYCGCGYFVVFWFGV